MPRKYSKEPSRTDQIIRKYDDLTEKLINNHSRAVSVSLSPIRVQNHHHHHQSNYQQHPLSYNQHTPTQNTYMGSNAGPQVDFDPDALAADYGLCEYGFDTNPDAVLRLKWLDNSPRMSRLREHRQKRLHNKLEQFELWDIEQSQKQKQFEKAREQRYNNIMERLKSQEFCVNTMKKRHESDLEATKDLETYNNDHLFVDALDDAEANIQGPITSYRKFEAEMDEKVKTLQNDLDTLNPRSQIDKAIMPRLERTRENLSLEPQIYTRSGKKILRRPNLDSPCITDLKQGSDKLNQYSLLISSYVNQQHQQMQNDARSMSQSNKYKRFSMEFDEATAKQKAAAAAGLKPIIHHPQLLEQEREDLGLGLVGGVGHLKSLEKLKDSHEQIRKSVNFGEDVRF